MRCPAVTGRLIQRWMPAGTKQDLSQRVATGRTEIEAGFAASRSEVGDGLTGSVRQSTSCSVHPSDGCHSIRNQLLRSGRRVPATGATERSTLIHTKCQSPVFSVISRRNGDTPGTREHCHIQRVRLTAVRTKELPMQECDKNNCLKRTVIKGSLNESRGS